MSPKVAAWWVALVLSSEPVSCVGRASGSSCKLASAELASWARSKERASFSGGVPRGSALAHEGCRTIPTGEAYGSGSTIRL